MPQFTQPYDEVKIPFQKMTFSPDVPPSALGPNEYNIGLNIETDVRGIRSVLGEEEILGTVPGVPTYITGGYRNSNYVVGVDDPVVIDGLLVTANGPWAAQDFGKAAVQVLAKNSSVRGCCAH